MSKPGGNTPLLWFLTLAFSGTSCDTRRAGVTCVAAPSRDSRSCSRAPLSCRRVSDRQASTSSCRPLIYVRSSVPPRPKKNSAGLAVPLRAAAASTSPSVGSHASKK
ncbi:hypothetical protein HYPSUDRAFT_209771 [Hypholoma sublateritium FD-334 SS-4]|uniref:Secreted protein n=1 Tax=Hypholoma sublateritium (strain FD-334 SS-4) TaxID=945553 RepID=A0A0D2N920_HYPSF|nr:hypothetical protein HYPSUDRAFT_209771 [Hypholoma sublateritium FD-334 SS-4]